MSITRKNKKNLILILLFAFVSSVLLFLGNTEFAFASDTITITYDWLNGTEKYVQTVTSLEEVDLDEDKGTQRDMPKEGYNLVLDCWTDINGNEYSGKRTFSEDTDLYARYKIQNTDTCILTIFDNDYSSQPTSIVSLNGLDATSTINDPYDLDLDVQGNYSTYYVSNYGFTKYPSIKFANKINTEEIQELVFRVYVHLSEGKIDNRFGGFAIAGLNATGEIGECFTIDADINQDCWVDFKLNRFEAKSLANADGYIEGFSCVSNFKYDKALSPTTDGSSVYVGNIYQKNGYVKLDYVAFTKKDALNPLVVINPENGDIPTSFFVAKGSKIDRPENPFKLGYDFKGWVDQNGNDFDFNSQVNEDLTLTPKYVLNVYNVLVDFDDDFSETPTKLTSLNGNDNKNTVNDPYEQDIIKNYNSKTQIQYKVCSYGFTKYPTVMFNGGGVSINSVKRIVIRMYVHLSPTTIDNRFGGFAFAGVENNGSNGCLSLNKNIVNNKWIDYVIAGENLNLFADSNGNFTGIAAISNFRYDLVVSPTTDGSEVYYGGFDSPNGGYVLIDFIAYEEKAENEVTVKLNKCNGEDDEYYYVQKGSTIITPNSPKKTGAVFNGWVDGKGQAFDFDTPIADDMDIYATYVFENTNLNVLVDFNRDYNVGNYSLKYINGNSREDNDIRFKIVQVGRPINETAIDNVSVGLFNTLSYGSLIYPELLFTTPVCIKDVDYLKFRLYVHLWDTAYDTNKGGVVICGVGKEGQKDECYMLSGNILQNQWIELMFTRKEAQLFCDESGYIKGFSIGSMFNYDPNSNTTGKGVYIGSDGYGGYVAIDYVGYQKRDSQESSFEYSVTFEGLQGENVQKVKAYNNVQKPLEIPAREDCKFLYWEYNGVEFDFENTIITKNIMLTPKFTYDTMSGSAYVGKYSNGDKMIELTSNSVIKIYNGGVLVFKDNYTILNSGKIIVDDSVVAKYESANVIYDSLTFIKTAESILTSYTVDFIVDSINLSENYSVSVYAGEKVAKPNSPQKQDNVFVGWYLSNDAPYDFNGSVNSSFALYARWESVTTLTNALTVQTTEKNLQTVEGITYKPNSNMYTYYQTELEQVEVAGAVNGKAYKAGFHTWAITIVDKCIVFDQTVNVNDIDGLTIRMFNHLSPASTYDTQNGGIRLYGLTYTGKVGEGIMIPSNIKQDEWFDFKISKKDAERLADKDGNIGGLQIGSSLYIADQNLGHEGVGAMYVLIDSVTVTETFEIKYNLDGKEYKFNIDKGSSIGNNYIVPSKDGYMFIGWKDENQNYVTKETVMVSDLSLTPTWKERQSFADYSGYYINANNDTILITSDKILLSNATQIEDVCINNGTIYYIEKGEIKEIVLSGYSTYQAISVTYDYGFGVKTEYYPKHAPIIPFDGTGIINSFVCWKTQAGDTVDFTKGFDGDVVVYAYCDTTESENYGDFVGYYICGDKIIRIQSNKKITVENKTYDCYISNDLITYNDGEKTVYGTITPHGIAFGNAVFSKMFEKYFVVFSTGSVVRTPERVEVLAINGYQMVEQLPILSADGFDFLGWYDKDGSKVSENKIFHDSTMLYAKWGKVDDTKGDTPEQNDDSTIGTVGLILIIVGSSVAVVLVLKKKSKGSKV